MKLSYAVAGASALTLAVAAPALAAIQPTTIKVGSSSAAGSHPVTASSQGALSFAAEKTDGSYLTMGCSSAAVPASPTSVVKSGTDLTALALIRKMNFTGCTGPGGTLTVTTSGIWKIQRTGGTVTAARTDKLKGQIVNVTADVGNLVCKFTVTGKARGTVIEKSQVLNVNQTGAGLKVSNVQGCGGQLKNNGRAKFVGKFKMVSPDGPINAIP